ncbi:YeeE/YedE family protein [Trichomonas vaginalis G3]|uniref:YeeE/YedE family protein n=1 Tax=Trichomonas vaginalis (strain ATCC PRA-98 / G3) TaxID=412133 RepID=A2E7V2_TRIV3|nr:sulfur transport [Trichomonas vaginalis G3]EAY11283.1 YeeE/YedE family protein [Trichomonas vaginalis G3]KAI5526675.1 sulfur transport [Trichomonas vaginalis G3]|eukprot:XP_001323506.1 YeeE/YedE family protein [Trichomonas vaginalis G3]
MEFSAKRAWLIIASLAAAVGYVLIVLLRAEAKYKAYLAIIAIIVNMMIKFSSFSFQGCYEKMAISGEVQQFRWLLITIIVVNLFVSVLKYFPQYEPLFLRNLHQGYFDQSQPVGVKTIVGSLIFGVGMQLSSGCILGMFTGIGDGSPRSFIAIATCIVGSTVGTLDSVYSWYTGLQRSTKPMKIHFGIMLAILIGLILITFAAERIVMGYKKTYEAPVNLLLNENIEKPSHIKEIILKVVQVGTALIAGGGLGVFYLLYGSMVNLEEGIPVFGARILQVCGLHPESWLYFSGKVIPENLLSNTSIIVNIGLIIGSFIASTIMGTFGNVEKSDAVACIKGAIGGFLVGLSSRISNGCTVSIVIGGMASSSMHGILWLVGSIIGCFATLKLTQLVTMKKKTSDDVAAYAVIP